MAQQDKNKDKVALPTVKSIVDIVAEKVNAFIQSGELDLPQNFSVHNALKSAYLALQSVVDKNNRPALEVCTKASIANALLDMVVQGLNVGKRQAYFIVYSNVLTCQRSYFGSMAVAEMVNPALKDWGFNVVYEGDTFKYGIHNGKAAVIEHAQELENIDKLKIVAAYAMALDKNGDPIKTEIMTIKEIHQAWKMSKMKPFDDNGELKPESTHGRFARDMALRTIINKVAKFIINASSDNALLLERINRMEDLADSLAAQNEIESKANVGTILMIQEETAKPDSPEKELDQNTIKEESGEQKANVRTPNF